MRGQLEKYKENVREK